MDGYYDYHPRIIPDRPLAITGFVGARIPLVGAAVTALTGLPLHELDRLIEHTAGISIPHLVIRDGEAAMRNLESKLLKRALDAKPPGVITLGEGTLLAKKNRAIIKKQAKLIYIELSVFELYTRVKQELSASPGKYLHLFADSPERAQDLQAFLSERIPLYREADLTINASQRHPTKIAQEIIDALGL